MGKGTSIDSSSPIKSPALIAPGKRRPHNTRMKPEGASPHSHRRKAEDGMTWATGDGVAPAALHPRFWAGRANASRPTNRPGVRRPAHEEVRRPLLVTPSEGHVDGTPQRPTLKRPSTIRFLNLCLSHRCDRIDFWYPLRRGGIEPSRSPQTTRTIDVEPSGIEVGPPATKRMGTPRRLNRT